MKDFSLFCREWQDATVAFQPWLNNSIRVTREEAAELKARSLGGDLGASHRLIQGATPCALKLVLKYRWAFRLDLDECIGVAIDFLMEIPERYDPSRGALLTFVYHVLPNRLRELKRRAERYENVQRHALPADPSDLLYRDDSITRGRREAEMLEVVDLLPPREAAVTRMKFFEGLSGPEIGERIGRCRALVNLVQHSALARLEELLAKGEG